MARRMEGRIKRKKRVRKNIAGTPERPRLCVFKSLNHFYAQIIDDSSGRTLASASSLVREMKEFEGHRGGSSSARRVGELIGAKAREANVKKVVFDRSGYPYHGSLKALAEAARQAGLEF